MPNEQSPMHAHPAKTALRDQLSTARNRRSLAEVSTAGHDLADRVLAAGEVRRAGTVAGGAHFRRFVSEA